MKVNQVMNAELCRAGEVWLEKRIPGYIFKKIREAKMGLVWRLRKTLIAALQTEQGDRLISRHRTTIRKLNSQKHEKLTRSPSPKRKPVAAIFVMNIEGTFCLLISQINQDPT